MPSSDLMFATIEQLYAREDAKPQSNIVKLTPGLTRTGASIVDDVEALLRDPDLRHLAEPVLKHVLSVLAQELLSPQKRPANKA